MVEIGLVDSVVVSLAVQAGRCFITGEHGEPMKGGVAVVEVRTGKDAMIGMLGGLAGGG